MNALAMIVMTPEQGLVVGAALVALGALTQCWIRLEADDRRDAKDQDREAAEDEALLLAEQPVEMVRVHALIDSAVPTQRITNGEDLLGGGDFR